MPGNQYSRRATTVLPEPFWVARGSRSGTVVGCGGVSLAMVSALLILRFGNAGEAAASAVLVGAFAEPVISRIVGAI